MNETQRILIQSIVLRGSDGIQPDPLMSKATSTVVCDYRLAVSYCHLSEKNNSMNVSFAWSFTTTTTQQNHNQKSDPVLTTRSDVSCAY